jgi:hypothetical protein
VEFNYSYHKDSLVNSRASSTSVSFAPDQFRQPTFFRGQLKQNVAFREGISALHDVVVSDMKWKPKNREAYQEWLKEQELVDWKAVAEKQQETAKKIEEIRLELKDLRSRSAVRSKAYQAAQRRYFAYLYTKDRDAWFVLDPVITVHPDELFFECFSQDESSYGRLGVNYNVFQNVGEFACGTTNIDYSQGLYDEFQKIRSYKETQFEIDPSGFEVETSGEETYKEVKIDLPDSWVRGFLQVSSALALPAATFDLHPMDVHNMCFVLRRNKELKGPRSIRYVLKPGQPVRMIFEPWNIEIECSRSIYTGHEEDEIRVWGRRRLHILERLIPVAKKFTVQLLGKGMPSFYIADLGDMSFTLGLSGWTANDWSSSGNFDLLAPRADVDSVTKQVVFKALSENWYETPDSLASRLGLERAVVLGALAAWTQAGRTIWDPVSKVYRIRELTREPLPLEKLRFANDREQAATRFLDAKAVKIKSSFTTPEETLVIEGKVKTGKQFHETSLKINSDERITEAQCDCNFHQQNRLRMGPCEHILALRMQFAKENQPSRLFSLFE